MKETYIAIIVGIAAGIIGVVASSVAVNRVTDLALGHAMELGAIGVGLEEQKEHLKQQKEELVTTTSQIRRLSREATGLEDDSEMQVRLDQLRALSERIGSDVSLANYLTLSHRIDALSDPSLMQCATETVEYAGGGRSCEYNTDWIPRAACPQGKFIRAIDVVYRHVPNEGNQCGFEIECCSSVGVPPSDRAGGQSATESQ